MGVKDDIKILGIQAGWNLKELAEEIGRRKGKEFKYERFLKKLSRGTLHYEEAKLIAEILGYDLMFVKKTK